MTRTTAQPTSPRRTKTPPTTQPRLGLVGWLRWTWRQLTSMRTALMLLMLLAVAAVPGSIWPQRSVDPPRVAEYLRENPTTGQWLDRFGFFDVYSSPWFAAIYLLLMVSLVGCILPRAAQHWKAMRSQPPRAPRNLTRLEAHARAELAAEPEQVLEAARTVLRRRRLRIRPVEEGRELELASEGGFLRETGNLVFHISLLAVIVSVAVGHLWGWRAEVILPEGESFTSQAARYDTLQAGPWVDENTIEPFSLRIDRLDVEFETEAGGTQFGAPRRFDATVTTTESPGAPEQQQLLGVNNPLHFGSTSVFLLGNGYATVTTITDGSGSSLGTFTTPFLPQDDNYGSTGAIKVTAADPQLGFYGAFLPTLRFDEEFGPVSDFPGLVEPGLVLGVWEGTLFPGGVPQSVYTLDTAQMEQVTTADGDLSRLLVRPGESIALPGDRGTFSFDEVVRWGGLAVRHDPGRIPVLISSIVLLGALITMLTVRRRRIFVRVTHPGEDHAEPDARHTRLIVAGLAKGSDPNLQGYLDDLLEQITAAAQTKDDA
ncbi:cytochrome c biogenesis protein ResB [Ornithinimicrobium cryptoxanthini]|uniref:Cytochrome c biogenesis protein ResB n=1 Tax=Ornithinimicrobium cryptoxanthini TaxID=2934161 RepID=A0ABY4YJQ2_9MICO|nr:cytochrome c biogenesis protein ResB [Ornithinimicrobium cryptoxanthini]USQ76761.1 cytochrome c biogenesis protein ResB [Ornithinimicrobium cryptoxanthini]